MLASMLWCLPLAASADMEKITPPAPAAHWRVEYSYDAEAGSGSGEAKAPESTDGAAARRLRMAEYEVFKDTARITKTFSDGSAETVYVQDDFLYRHDSQTRRPMVEPIASDEIDYQCLKGYPEFLLPVKKGLVETVDAFGQKCALYRAEIASAEATGGVTWEGWISSTTKRPVAFRRGDTLGRFVFAAPPTGPVVLPQEFVDLAKVTFKAPPPPGSLAGKRR